MERLPSKLGAVLSSERAHAPPLTAPEPCAQVLGVGESPSRLTWLAGSSRSGSSSPFLGTARAPELPGVPEQRREAPAPWRWPHPRHGCLPERPPSLRGHCTGRKSPRTLARRRE